MRNYRSTSCKKACFERRNLAVDYLGYRIRMRCHHASSFLPSVLKTDETVIRRVGCLVDILRNKLVSAIGILLVSKLQCIGMKIRHWTIHIHIWSTPRHSRMLQKHRISHCTPPVQLQTPSRHSSRSPLAT